MVLSRNLQILALGEFVLSFFKGYIWIIALLFMGMLNHHSSEYHQFAFWMTLELSTMNWCAKDRYNHYPYVGLGINIIFIFSIISQFMLTMHFFINENFIFQIVCIQNWITIAFYPLFIYLKFTLSSEEIQNFRILVKTLHQL